MRRAGSRSLPTLPFIAFLLTAATVNPQGVITTVAGTNWTFPLTPLPAVNAPLGRTSGAAVDAKGNIYIADTSNPIADIGNSMVMRVSPDGALTVVAGNGTRGFSGDGGPATSASLRDPSGVGVDSAGSLYIADTYNARIRKVSGGIITTVAGNGTPGFSGDGGPATSASLNGPFGVAVDSAGNLYIADQFNNRIRKVSGGIITTVAGNGTPGFAGDGGPATSSSLNLPRGLAVDSAGSLYIADSNNSRIRKVSGGIITTVAGNGMSGSSGDGGPATSASLSSPDGVAVDSAGNLYMADRGHYRIREVSGGIIATVAGNGTRGFSGDGGPATSASLKDPSGVAVDSAGNVYIADSGNNRIRKVSDGTITTFAGNQAFKFAGEGGPATSASLNRPFGVAVDSAGSLYMADSDNNRIRKVSDGIITTVAGNGAPGFSGDGGPATSASLNLPIGVAVDSAGSLYIADSNNNRIRKVSGGIITTVAGNGAFGFSGDGGPATSASLVYPYAVAVDSADNLYTADYGNNRIRKVSGEIITTVAGNGTLGSSGDGGPATSASLYSPTGVALDSAGNLYIADYGGNRIRKVSGEIIATVAGNGTLGFSGDGGPATSASLFDPYAVAVDSVGNLFVADTGNSRIRKVSNGIVTTLAGNATRGFSGDGGPATRASLAVPQGVVADSAGNLYIADSGNNRIREVPSAPISLMAAPTSLTFAATTGGATPATHSLNLSSSVNGLSFSVSSSDSWLNVTPAGGSTPTVLQVSVDPSQLSAKNYAGNITITAPGATQTVSVNLNVSQAATGKLAVSSPSVAFSVTQGSASTSTQFSVSNQGGGSIGFTAIASTSTGGSWLQVSPTSGTATPTSAASLTVTATPGSLSAGTYTGNIVVNSSTTGESIPVPVTLSISAAQQKVLLSQTGLTFVAVEQGGTPLPQNFGILNTGRGSMSWSASSSTLSGGSWLSIDQKSGTVSMPFTDVSLVNVSVNSAGLKSGNYYGQIQVASPGAANSPQSVSVVLNVLPLGGNPGPEVRPTGLIFIGAPGSSPGSQNVKVSNPQGSPITFGGNFFTVPTGGNWVQFLPTNATVPPNAPARILVQPDYTSLASGVYQGFVSLGFLDGSSRSVHILSVVAPPGGTGSVSPSGGPSADRAASGCTTLLVHPTALTDPSGSVTVGQPASLQARVVDNCGNLLTTGSVTATFTNNDALVNLVHVGSGNWSGTWTPRSGTQPQVTVKYVAFAGQGTTLLSGSATLTVSLAPGATAPLTFGAANAASGAGTFISPGGLVSIYGQQLADQPGQPNSAPFPKTLNGTQVLMGGKALPLRYVGSGQVNAQVPFELGINTQQQLVVQRGTTLSVPQDVAVAAAQPAVYTQDQSGAGPGVIVDANTGALVTPATPARVGDVVVIYCNGLGAVDPPVPSGTPAPVDGPLSRTANPLSVMIGEVKAQVNFAGLAPGYPDLYQVNAVVPAGVAGSALPVVLSLAGQTSPPVTMAVR